MYGPHTILASLLAASSRIMAHNVRSRSRQLRYRPQPPGQTSEGSHVSVVDDSEDFAREISSRAARLACHVTIHLGPEPSPLPDSIDYPSAHTPMPWGICRRGPIGDLPSVAFGLLFLNRRQQVNTTPGVSYGDGRHGTGGTRTPAIEP